jgi:hypothetical protein
VCLRLMLLSSNLVGTSRCNAGDDRYGRDKMIGVSAAKAPIAYSCRDANAVLKSKYACESDRKKLACL